MSNFVSKESTQWGSSELGVERVIEMGNHNLTVEDVVDISRNGIPVELTQSARAIAVLSHESIKEIVENRPVYGQSTGVGANKTELVESDESENHGVRLLRSHALNRGPEVDSTVARAMLAIRLNQLANGGSGINPNVLDILASAVNTGLTPKINRYGSIGTGDLSALSVTALTIMGERSWDGGSLLSTHTFEKTDALPFISSNALVQGESAISCHDISRRFEASLAIAALSFVAMSGSIEAYSEEVHRSQSSGQIKIAEEMRNLIDSNVPEAPRRIQDSYSLRALPQINGPVKEALEDLTKTINIEINASSENPLVSIESKDVYHNANFMAAKLGLSLDGLRAALYGSAALSVERLKGLMEPNITTLRPFLACGPEASSGVLILEYVTGSVLPELNTLAQPDSLKSAVHSRGTEEFTSFAAQSAWHTADSIKFYEEILASELVASVRAIRQQDIKLKDGKLKETYDQVVEFLNPDMDDRNLDTDLNVATELVRNYQVQK